MIEFKNQVGLLTKKHLREVMLMIFTIANKAVLKNINKIMVKNQMFFLIIALYKENIQEKKLKM